MTLYLRRPVALLLVILLFISAIPVCFASEADLTGVPIPSEPAVDPPNEDTSEVPPEIVSPASETPPETKPLDSEDEPSLEPDDDEDPFANLTEEEIIAFLDESGISLMSTTSSNITLFDQASPNYTVVLNSQISVTYQPNGTDSAQTAYLKNVGWHYAGSNPDHTIYCIEPYKEFGASTSLNAVDRDVTISGSGSTNGATIWYSLPVERRIAIGLILLYSEQRWDYNYPVKSTPKASNPNVPLRTATQFLIYEIVTGLRNPSTFVRNSSNGYTSGDVYYNAGVNNVSGFASCYNALVSDIQAQLLIPSFTSSSSSSAPTITMDGTSKTVTDTNGVLSQFSFSNGNGASFSKNGNNLTITKAGDISESTVFSCSRTLPSAENSTYNLWYSPYISSRQTLVSLYSPSSGSVNGYFKIKANSTGNLSLTKTTDDGQNLQGWQFSIYSNAACTNLVSGPHTTNSSGRISVTGLNAGTYYVKEIGHTNAAINALYACASKNPQQVIISAGGTASVSFANNRLKGSIQITKTTNTGTNLSGWKIGIYTDASCTKPVSGSPFVTGANGKVTVSNLLPGTYYAREVDESASNPYWEYDTSVKPVTVTANQAATISFTNIQYGELRIHKNAVNGSAEGWTFYLHSKAGDDILRTMETGADGYAYSGKLLPGTYTVREVKLGDETYWEYDANVERIVTITAGSQTTVEYTNTQYGMLEFHKTTNTGHHLEGWSFLLYKEGEKIGEYATDANGYACTGKLTPGRYTVQERNTEDVYWNGNLNLHTVTVTAGETAADYWRNCEVGRGIFRKTTNTGENLSGWIITVYSDAACTQEVKTVTTEEDGTVKFMLEPGTYYAKETGDTNGRFESEYWLVDGTAKQFEIKGHEDTEVNFVNTHFGKILVVKTMEDNGSLENWQFRITNKDGDSITAATDADGQLLTDNLLPGEYTVEEILPQDSPYVCLSSNPQRITVAEGKTAEVSFVNGIRPGKIVIQKNDITGNPLAGAQFCLEWSEDGSKWTIVVPSDQVAKGKCQAAGLVNGCLTTGETGLIQWTNLYPGLYYRVTEAKAPDGYTLLDEPVFSAKLSGDKLEASFTVVNSRVFSMPETGSNTLRQLMIAGILLAGLSTCIALVSLFRRKRI